VNRVEHDAPSRNGKESPQKEAQRAQEKKHALEGIFDFCRYPLKPLAFAGAW
jgi:hypothetical protein